MIYTFSLLGYPGMELLELNNKNKFLLNIKNKYNIIHINPNKSTLWTHMKVHAI